MDLNNISAQLFNKQLPFDANAMYTGCNPMVQPGPQYMTTCVDPFDSDRKIEMAFQQQLSLAEHYKTPEVFDAVKRDFMDETGDYIKEPVSKEHVPGTSMRRERFGASEKPQSNAMYYLIGLVLLLIVLNK